MDRVANVHSGSHPSSAMVEKSKSKNPPGIEPGGFGD